MPDTSVEFWGHPEVDSVSASERRNLPEQVEPGAVYRDIEVRWRAAARVVRPPGG